ncbi:hypothetical protein CMI42_04105 [Candidatus Pacearchaeota archaeon]|nr:hypothetical protein [Candidatus Pacearchaeota archaeon]
MRGDDMEKGVMNRRSNSRSCLQSIDYILPSQKRSQITIFVIVASIIVVSVIIIFLLIKGPEVRVLDENNPQAFIESCTREAVEEAIEILSKQGGDIKPKGSLNYEDEEIAYLCYNINFYERCVNQRPLLIEHIENEITEFIKPKVGNCFFNLESNLRGRYEIETGEMELRTVLQPKTVIVEIDKGFKMTRNEEVRDFEGFKMSKVHPIYDLAEIGMKIVNQESKYCNFDELGHMILYPEYDIKKFILGDANLVYRVSERGTGEEFNFAIRSCALPAGY